CRLARGETIEPDLLPAEAVQVVRGRRLEAGARRSRPRLLHALRHEDLPRHVRVGGGTVVLLPRDPRHGIVPRGRGAPGDRRVLRRPVGVDVERRHVRAGGTVLAGGKPQVRTGVEAAGEDVRRVAELRIGLVPGDPGGGAAGPGEVDRRRLGHHGGGDVERRREALRDPGAVLERTDEDLLRAADLLLERRPRDLDLAGDDRAAGHVDQAGVLARIDRVRRVVVHLGAVRRERYEGRRGGGNEKQR